MDAYSITEGVVAWLASLGYAASSQVPPDMPDEFVTVERTGGYDRNLVDHATVAVQCWGTSDDTAEALANRVRLALRLGDPPDGIHGVSVNTAPYRFNDPVTRRPRYQMVLDVSCRVIA